MHVAMLLRHHVNENNVTDNVTILCKSLKGRTGQMTNGSTSSMKTHRLMKEDFLKLNRPRMFDGLILLVNLIKLHIRERGTRPTSTRVQYLVT